MNAERQMQAFAQLRQRAAAGDLQAQATLERITMRARHEAQRRRQATARQGQAILGLVEAGAFDHMLVQPEQQEAETSRQRRRERAPDGVQTEPDELDIADTLRQQMPTSDSLAWLAALKHKKHDQLNEAAPFVRIAPPSVLRGTLGQTVTCWTGDDLLPNQLPEQQVALWQGEDSESQPITVSLSPVTAVDRRDFTGAIPALFRPYAIIQFGTRGMSVNFVCDIMPGTQFTVCGSNVSVQVGLLATAGQPAGSMDLAGMLSFGATHRMPVPVTRTLYVPASAGGAAFSAAIPNFAKKVTLFKQVAANNMLVVLVDSQGVSRGGVNIPAGTTFNTVPIPISGQIASITVIENAAGAYDACDLIFELGF